MPAGWPGSRAGPRTPGTAAGARRDGGRHRHAEALQRARETVPVRSVLGTLRDQHFARPTAPRPSARRRGRHPPAGSGRGTADPRGTSRCRSGPGARGRRCGSGAMATKRSSDAIAGSTSPVASARLSSAPMTANAGIRVRRRDRRRQLLDAAPRDPAPTGDSDPARVAACSNRPHRRSISARTSRTPGLGSSASGRMIVLRPRALAAPQGRLRHRHAQNLVAGLGRPGPAPACASASSSRPARVNASATARKSPAWRAASRAASASPSSSRACTIRLRVSASAGLKRRASRHARIPSAVLPAAHSAWPAPRSCSAASADSPNSASIRAASSRPTASAGSSSASPAPRSSRPRPGRCAAGAAGTAPADSRGHRRPGPAAPPVRPPEAGPCRPRDES